MTAMERFVGDPLHLIPYGVLSAAALLLLIGSFGRFGQENRPVRKAVAALGLLGAALSFLLLPSSPGGGLFLAHEPIGIGFALVFLFLLLLLFPVLPFRTETLKIRPSAGLSLLLLGACGGLWMIFADHLLLFFVGLELLSLPLYVICGLGSDGGEGTEAAFKYFILGTVASAFFLLGTAFFWGGTGSMQISSLSAGTEFPAPRWALFGSVLMFAGVAFKIGLAPFHMWVPDVYEGAPATLVSWMAGGVKAAAVVVALRLFGGVPLLRTELWADLLSAVAILSMVWGSFGALPQSNVKRMLGYSSIAHAGYLLIAVVCAVDGSYAEVGPSLSYYLLAYGVASLIAFLVVSIEEGEGRVRIADLSGLISRKPALAFALAVSLFSLAGLPPLGGFVGKFNVFVLAAQRGRYALLIVAMATSVVSLGYYLRLIVAAFMEAPAVTTPLKVGRSLSFVVAVAVVATFVLGLLPWPVLNLLAGGR